MTAGRQEPEITDVLSVLDHFGETLHGVRTLRGVSLRGLDAITGVDFNTIRRIESGQTNARVSAIRTLMAWVADPASFPTREEAVRDA